MVSSDGSTLIVYRGNNMVFHVYNTDPEMGTHTLKDTIDLAKELQRVSKSGEQFDESDTITDLRMLND